VALLVLLSACAAVAVAAAAASGRGRAGPAAAAVATTASAPTCAPATLDTSARLPGTPLLVTPAPGGFDAMPQTQISFLGAPASRLTNLRVQGIRSGLHTGRLEPYSQGDGASFLPRRPFAAGEEVGVSGDYDGVPFAYGFTVGEPDPIARLPEHGTPAGASGTVWHFHSAPGISPPVLSVTKTSATARRDGDIFMAAYPGPGQTGPTIYDPTGQLVYFKPLPANTFATDVRVQSYRGRRVLTWWQGTISHHGFGLGEGEIYSTAYRHVATVRAGDGLAEDLHELTLTPSGTALITAWKPLYCNLSALGGRAVAGVYDSVFQEIDVRTGLVMYEWDSIEHVPLSATYMPVHGASVAWPYDWFHLNSIAPEGDGSLLISSRATWAVYDLDAATGQIRWQVGGRTPTYAMPSGVQLAWQHDAEPLGPGLFSVFDNGGSPTQKHSLGAVVRIDTATATAAVIHTVQIPTPIYAETQGDLQLLPDGSWWIGWGNVNESSQVSASGAQLFEAHTPAGSESYRTLRYPWGAQPATAPSLTLLIANARSLRAYVSWNGATAVARWRIEAGRSPRALEPVHTFARTGFETTALVPSGAAYYAVEALDARGHVLGSSPPEHALRR
jgi:hypothetical protein